MGWGESQGAPWGWGMVAGGSQGLEGSHGAPVRDEGSRGSHQALEQPGGAGDDDEEFLHQLGDEGHLLRLRALVGLGGHGGVRGSWGLGRCWGVP